jgi:amidohydrolase
MMIDKNYILKKAKKLLPSQIKLRREFHQNPELSFEEFQTTKRIKDYLKKHRIKTKPLQMKTGAVGIVNEKAKQAVAIRTDIDALPITEQSSLPFRSKKKGLMHACGHDIHMAVVLGVASLLNEIKDELPGGVKFIFQPATVPTGKITLRDGPTMASVIDFDITVLGQGGHAAMPHRAIDAIAVASELVGSAQKIVSREINPLKPVVLTFALINGGRVRNVIADKVLLQGTARTLAPENMKKIPQLIKRTVDGICRAHGAKYEIKILSGYPVLSNHEKANRILSDAAAELFGGRIISTTPQTMGGEDFALYLKEVPGAMFRLGIRNNKIGANKHWHSSEFIADEESIYYGTALLSLAVLRFLKK